MTSADVPDRPMRVLERGVFRGPHVYGLRPMVRVMLDLGRMEAWPTDRLDGFTDQLLAALPGLQRHHCSLGHPGGFVERLREGTWLGHVVEHVALELQALARARDVSRGKTRSVKDRPGVYNILCAFEDEEQAFAAVRLALQIVNGLLPEHLQGVERLDAAYANPRIRDLDRATTCQAAVGIVKDIGRRNGFGPSTGAIVEAARRRGVPVARLNEQSLVQLGWGSKQRLIRASVTGRTGLIAAELAGNKAEAKALLDSVGIPVARGVVVSTVEEALKAAEKLKRPLVIKPLDGNHGRGVTVGLVSEDEIRHAFDLAKPHGRRVILEEQLPGRDHRVLVVDGRIIAVAERVPPHVVGDGRSTIGQLVEAVNADPRRGSGHENVLTAIRLDEAALACLASQNLTPGSVPDAGRTVLIKTTANLSAGGTAVDRTDVIHPDNAAICRRAALQLGLDVAGIDLLCPDITRSVRETGGGIVEVNAAPGLRMHLQPSEGLPRDVGEPIVRSLFPRGSGRIPVLAVTGTNGKSTTGRMVAHILKAQGMCVGLTNTSGVYIGEERAWAGDASGPRSARMVLNDASVDVAVLECARGGILREGLAFDRCDVGAVLNIQPDHLGLKGVNTLEDLATVKSVVVEAVSRRGVSVLNADDPQTIRMARWAGGRVCWFSMRGGHQTPGVLMRHIAEGGMAILHDAETDEITLHDRGEVFAMGLAADIPATLGGQALFNVQNAMAAAAMAYGVGVAPQRVREALTSFRSSFEQNPGRLNVHDDHGFRVILDYAHNPEGLRALGRMVKAITPPEQRSIAMISIPGDRRDEDIRAMGEVASEFFDQLVFRESPDTRGRKEGEIGRLMSEGARRADCEPSRFRTVLSEEEAAVACLDMARPGDVVVLTPTQVERVWKLVQDHRPKFQPTLDALADDRPGMGARHG